MASPDSLAITGNIPRATQPGRVTFYRLHPAEQNAFPLSRNTSAAIPIERGQKTFRIERPGIDGLPLRKKPATGDARTAEIHKAASGFESIFLRHLLETMRSTVPGGGLFGSGASGEIYSDMMDNSLAEVMSSRDDLGIAGMIAGKLAKTSPAGTGAAKAPVSGVNSIVSERGAKVLIKDWGRE